MSTQTWQSASIANIPRHMDACPHVNRYSCIYTHMWPAMYENLALSHLARDCSCGHLFFLLRWLTLLPLLHQHRKLGSNAYIGRVHGFCLLIKPDLHPAMREVAQDIATSSMMWCSARPQSSAQPVCFETGEINIGLTAS
jgi:hypothetical protein